MRKAALDDPYRRVRYWAAWIFGQVRYDDPDLPAVLEQHLAKEKDNSVRRNLRNALKTIRARQNPPASQPAEE